MQLKASEQVSRAEASFFSSKWKEAQVELNIEKMKHDSTQKRLAEEQRAKKKIEANCFCRAKKLFGLIIGREFKRDLKE